MPDTITVTDETISAVTVGTPGPQGTDTANIRVGTSYLSLSGAGAVSDANLASTVTTTAGMTEQRGLIQPLLDTAALSGGELNLVWDVRCCVGWEGNGTDPTKKGLIVHGNTTIIALPGCGAILRNGTNAPIFRNANPAAGTTSGTANIVDENITIDGGTWHGNATQQAHDTVNSWWGWTVGMFFCGVRNLRLANLSLLKPRTIGFHFLNWERLDCENVYADASQPSGINYNGFQFEGPGSKLSYRDIYLAARDDCFAVNADDGVLDPSVINWTPYYTGGPVYWVRGRNLTGLESNSWGLIRLLSSGSSLDDVVLDGIYGQCFAPMVIIDNLSQSPSYVTPNGSGNFGDIEIRNVFAYATDQTGFQQTMVYVNADGRRLRLLNVRRFGAPQIAVPTLLQAGGAWNQIEVDGYNVEENNAANYTHFDFAAGSADIIKVRNAVVRQTNGAATGTMELVRVRSGYSVGSLLDVDGVEMEKCTQAVRIQAGVPGLPALKVHGVTMLPVADARPAVWVDNGTVIERARTGHLLCGEAIHVVRSGGPYSQVLDHQTDGTEGLPDLPYLPLVDNFHGSGSLDGRYPDSGAAKYQVLSGAWTLTSGGTVATGTLVMNSVIYDGRVADATVSVIIQPNGNANAGLRFNVQDDSNYWVIRMERLPGLGFSRWSLYKYIAGVPTAAVPAVNASFVDATDYTVQVITAGDNVTVSIDGTPLTGMNAYNAVGRPLKTATPIGLDCYKGADAGADVNTLFKNFTATA